MTGDSPRVVTILSTADFEAKLWTNKQYLATFLCERVRTIYIESMGLRRPKINRSDIYRILRRLLTSKRSVRAPANLVIVKPVVLPWHSVYAVRQINGFLLRAQLRRYGVESEHSVLWSFSPITYGLERLHGKYVYHSVDFLHQLPHMDTELLVREETIALKRADVAIASSAAIADHLRSERSDVLLWPNVADLRVFGRANGSRVPAAVFGGHLTPTKVDCRVLIALADEGIQVHLAGPQAIDGVPRSDELQELLAHRMVRYHGTLGTPALAELYEHCSVGLVPYLSNNYTDGVMPMKTFEYLACGLAVVATGVPSLSVAAKSARQEDLTLVRSSDFVREVLARIESIDDESIRRRRRLAREHSWESRMQDVFKLLSL